MRVQEELPDVLRAEAGQLGDRREGGPAQDSTRVFAGLEAK
jgi:hypothetical protein